MENQSPPVVPDPNLVPSTNAPITPESKPKRKNPLIIIGIILFLLIAIGISTYAFFQTKKPEQIACTMEVKVCPDGSSVGRSGPKCEFAPCPTAAPDPTLNWKTYENTKYGFSFKYPTDWKWSEKAINQPEPPYYLGILDIDDLITKEKYDADPFGCEFPPCTKEDFIKEKNSVVPSETNKYWNYIKIANKNASLMFYYEFHAQTDMITASIYTDTAKIIISKEIPTLLVPSGTTKENAYKYINENVARAQKINDDFILKDSYPNEETRKEITIFKQILSTFKFITPAGGSTPTPTPIKPGPTCMPRPSCLDSTPSCMIPEPATGWCK